MTEPISADQAMADAADVLGISPGGHPDDLEPDVSEAELIKADDESVYPEDTMSSEEAQDIWSSGQVPEVLPGIPSAPEVAAAPVAEEEASDGSIEWANDLLANHGRVDAAPADAAPAEMISPEVAQMQVRLATLEAERRQQLRDEELYLTGDAEPEPEAPERMNYSSAENLAGYAASFNLDQDTARIIGAVLDIAVKHHDENVVAPQLEGLQKQISAQGDRTFEQDRSQVISGNLESVKAEFQQGGNQLEHQVMEQFSQHGENSELFRYLAERDNNKFLLHTPQGIRDAVDVVAGRVLRGRARPAPQNGRAAREAVGEETFATVGRAVRRSPGSRSTPKLSADEEYQRRILNSGRRALAFMGD